MAENFSKIFYLKNVNPSMRAIRIVMFFVIVIFISQ